MTELEFLAHDAAGAVVWKCGRKDEADAISAALLVPNVAKHLEGRKIVKVIYKPGRVINLITEAANGHD